MQSKCLFFEAFTSQILSRAFCDLCARTSKFRDLQIPWLGSGLIGRTFVAFITLALLLMAVLPLLGFNLILMLGLLAILRFDPATEVVYLFVGRSAGLATATFLQLISCT